MTYEKYLTIGLVIYLLWFYLQRRSYEEFMIQLEL